MSVEKVLGAIGIQLMGASFPKGSGQNADGLARRKGRTCPIPMSSPWEPPQARLLSMGTRGLAGAVWVAAVSSQQECTLKQQQWVRHCSRVLHPQWWCLQGQSSGSSAEDDADVRTTAQMDRRPGRVPSTSKRRMQAIPSS